MVAMAALSGADADVVILNCSTALVNADVPEIPEMLIEIRRGQRERSKAGTCRTTATFQAGMSEKSARSFVRAPPPPLRVDSSYHARSGPCK